MKYFIIDFDSTFVKSEGLEVLAAVSLKNNPDNKIIVKKIKEITHLGMEGKIPFPESLDRRLNLLKANKRHLEETIKILKKNISPSIQRNKNFFKKNQKNIYIISGGFSELVEPVVAKVDIKPNNVLANSFIYDNKDNIVGFDKANPLAQKEGKVKAVRSLNLKGEIYVIGDGYTDYQIKKLGAARKFFAFTETIKREKIISLADRVVPSFDEFLYINRLPQAISYPKSRIKTLLLENIDHLAVKKFEHEGFPVEYYEKSLPDKLLAEKIKDVFILGIRSQTEINMPLLNQAKRLLTIGAFCIGVNQINLEEAAKRGMVVFNAPYSNTRSVVELILGEIIMLARGIFEKNNKMQQGIWDKSAKNSIEVRGKNLGIIGYGNIGSQLSVLAEDLGMRVYFYDMVEKLALGNAKRCQSLTDLLKKSDVVTVHVDGRGENKNLIAEKEFKLMKDRVLFLNTSRGFVVNIPALVKYLKNGKIRGAAIDVFPQEPKSREEKFFSPLQKFPNVILTPHIGGSTIEAQTNIADFVSEKIIDYINCGSTYLSVNIPNIQLPKQKNTHRLLHLHHNVPGILAKINGIFAKHNINIEGQYLKTNDTIGYVITDVNKRYNQGVLKELKKVPDTIRFRVLY